MSTSLLNGAKAVADAARLQWAEVHRYYRDLQVEPTFIRGEQVGPDSWLPKSQGRNVWPAHPHYIARLLIALGAAGDASSAREAVQWTTQLTRDGRAGMVYPRGQNIVEMQLARLLTDAAEAASVEAVEFRMDVREVVIVRRKGGETITFADQTGAAVPRGINWRGVIPGSVFEELNSAIVWPAAGEPPLTSMADGAADPEA